MSNSAFSRIFWRYLHRSDDGAAWRWMLFLSSILALFPVLGSAISAIVVGGGLVAWVYVLVCPARFWRWEGREKTVAVIFVAYVAVTLAFALAHDNAIAGLSAVVNNLGFIAVLPLFPVLHYFYAPDWEPQIVRSIGIGGCLTGLVAIASATFWGSLRVEALAGNPLIYAYMAGALTLLNGRLWLHVAEKAKWLHALATVLSLVAVIFSGSRAPVIIVLLIGGVGLFLHVVQKGVANWRRVAFVGYIVLVGLAGLYFLLSGTNAFKSIDARMSVLVDTAAYWDVPKGDSGVFSRTAMYKAGYAAFIEHPFAGYGRQNAVTAASQFTDGPVFPYSHLHNIFLTEAVASGILGLIAVSAVLLTPLLVVANRRSVWWSLSILFTIYNIMYDMTNIGFSHDIKVLYFCSFVVVLSTMDRRSTALSPRTATNYVEYLNREMAGLKGS